MMIKSVFALSLGWFMGVAFAVATRELPPISMFALGSLMMGGGISAMAFVERLTRDNDE